MESSTILERYVQFSIHTLWRLVSAQQGTNCLGFCLDGCCGRDSQLSSPNSASLFHCMILSLGMAPYPQTTFLISSDTEVGVHAKFSPMECENKWPVSFAGWKAVRKQEFWGSQGLWSHSWKEPGSCLQAKNTSHLSLTWVRNKYLLC